MLFEPVAQCLVDKVFDHRTNLGRTSLSLVCEENFGSGTLTERTASQALAAIFALQANLFLLQNTGGIGIGSNLPCQSRTEASHVRATIPLGNIVRKAQHILVVAVIPPQGHFPRNAVFLAREYTRLIDQRFLARSR